MLLLNLKTQTQLERFLFLQDFQLWLTPVHVKNAGTHMALLVTW